MARVDRFAMINTIRFPQIIGENREPPRRRALESRHANAPEKNATVSLRTLGWQGKRRLAPETRGQFRKSRSGNTTRTRPPSLRSGLRARTYTLCWTNDY
jgi:hypothetical protein